MPLATRHRACQKVCGRECIEAFLPSYWGLYLLPARLCTMPEAQHHVHDGACGYASVQHTLQNPVIIEIWELIWEKVCALLLPINIYIDIDI